MEAKNRNSGGHIESTGTEKDIYEDYSYGNYGLRPAISFWREMAVVSGATPKVLVPNTLIVNDKVALEWVYTGKDGRLAIYTNTSLKAYVSSITNFCSPNELCAIIKRLTSKSGSNNYGNYVKLVNSGYLQNLNMQQFGDQVVCLQKYVKSNGNCAFICRTVYKPKGCSSCSIITNKTSYYEETESEVRRFLVVPSRSHNVSTCQGKHLSETKMYLKEIVEYFKFQRGISLSEIIGDFIKDYDKNWWLVNVKGFKVEEKLCRQLNESRYLKKKCSLTAGHYKYRYQKTKNCLYCEGIFLECYLAHVITRKMLIEMDRYLLHIGKDFNWLLRYEGRIDSHSLYYKLKICDRCYRLYTYIQDAMVCEGEYLTQLGHQLYRSPQYLLMILTNTYQLYQQAKSKYIYQLDGKLPYVIQLGPNSKIFITNGYPILNDEIINKMYRYRLIVYLHEIDQVGKLYEGYNYFLEYELFGNKQKIKIDIKGCGMTNNWANDSKLCERWKYSKHNESKMTVDSGHKVLVSAQGNGIIGLRNLRVIYFFAHSDDHVQKHIASANNFLINLVAYRKNVTKKERSSYLENCESRLQRTSGYSKWIGRESKGSKSTTNESKGVVETKCSERRVIGSLTTPLKDILNVSSRHKSLYKYFTVQDVIYGWGLYASVGIIRSDYVINTSRLIFTSYDKLVYLPDSSYYCCYALPEYWMQEIMAKSYSSYSRMLKAKQYEFMTRQSEASGVSSVCEKETVEVDRYDGEEDRSDWSRMLQKYIYKYGKRKEKVDKFGMNVIKVMDF